MTLASRDAVAFPARQLTFANNSASQTDVTFSELAKMVGQTKGHYPDEA